MKRWMIILGLAAACTVTGNPVQRKTDNKHSAVTGDVAILIPAGYRSTEVSDFTPMLDEEWYDLFSDEKTGDFRLLPAEIGIDRWYDECLQDSATYVGSGRNSLVLVRGITPKNDPLLSFPVEKPYIWPGESWSFRFGDKAYRLHVEGTVLESERAWLDGYDEPQRWDDVKDYRLYISFETQPEKQLVLSIPRFNYTFVEILWIGDLDEDGLPDLLLDTSDDYESKSVELYLSSKALPGDHVGLAGSSGYQFDC